MKRTILAVAVILALGVAGGAAAAGQITGKAIKDSTITGKDVKNRSLTPKDFKGSVRGPRGFTGAAGAQGAQGAPGAAGPAGQTGIAEIVAAQGNGIGSATAYCPAGMRPVSGGGIEEGPGYLWASGMIVDSGRTGWTVAGDADSPVTAFVYCSSGVSKITLPNGTIGRVQHAARTR
jgi:hypothetical protein